MKKGLFSVLATAAAVAVAAVAATTYIKKKSEKIADYLDYEPDEDLIPDEDADYVEIMEEIETIPPFKEETTSEEAPTETEE